MVTFVCSFFPQSTDSHSSSSGSPFDSPMATTSFGSSMIKEATTPTVQQVHILFDKMYLYFFSSDNLHTPRYTQKEGKIGKI